MPERGMKTKYIFLTIKHNITVSDRKSEPREGMSLPHITQHSKITDINMLGLGFPGGTVVKNLPANAGDMGSSPGPGRSHMPQSS